MSAVFISYRRSGAKQTAYRLKDKLKQAFGADKVFIDLEDIDAGLPFADVIKDTIRRCTVVLIVIGPRWLDMQDTQGARRLDDADDWVRQEIEAAMKSQARVIPVLVDGAAELEADEVPESLRAFAGLQAMRLSEQETYWHYDVERLVEKILNADPGLSGGGKRKQVGFSGKAIAALAIAGILLLAIAQEEAVLDHDEFIAAVVFGIVAFGLGIWGYFDVQAERARGRAAAIGGIVLASLVTLAAIGSLPDPVASSVVSVPGQETVLGLQGGVDRFDPDRLPATAAIPKQVQIADISGAWVGTDGSRYVIEQSGRRFEFNEFDPSGGLSASGSGVIRGSLIESEFQTADNTWGVAKLQLSADRQTMTGSYTDQASGETAAATLYRR